MKAMKKHALLVGVERYEDPAIDSLKFAAADASALGAKLREICGFDRIRILADGDATRPTKNAVLDAFVECADGLDSDDLFLFFFAGHGVEVNGASVLLTCDTRLARSHHGITRQDLDCELAKVRAGKRILIFDACRNAPESARSGAGNAMAETFARDIRACAENDSDSYVGTSLLFACKAGQRAYECADSGHGVLTHFLLEGLAKPEEWPHGELQFPSWVGVAQQRVSAWVRANTGHEQSPYYHHFGYPILDPLAMNTRAAADQGIAVSAPLESEIRAETAIEQHVQRETSRERKAGDLETVMLPGKVPLELVWCPPGTFWMGSSESEATWQYEWQYDKTRRRVTLTRGFWLGKYPVTQKQWESVMGAGTNPSGFKGAELPVEQVSWEDSQKFLKKVNALTAGDGFRLPTEAEWEYACRAGTETAFCYGNSLDSAMANFNGKHPYGGGEEGIYRKKTTQVGMFQPNGWGLYDMHGNVCEWCQDLDGDYTSEDAIDPEGAASGSSRVLRGGCWVYGARRCRSASRNCSAPSDLYNYLGFRVARVCHEQQRRGKRIEPQNTQKPRCRERW